MEREIYELLKDELKIQDEALKKLIWVIYRNFYYDGDMQNVLLLGNHGTGKTTLVRKVTNLLDIPLAEVYDMFDGDIDYNAFVGGLYDLASQNDDEKAHGVMLMHDFQDSFLYGNFSEISRGISSNNFHFGDNHLYKSSGIMFIGEVNTSYMENIFNKDVDLLEELENNNFLSPTLRLIRSIEDDGAVINVDSKGNRKVELDFEKAICMQIRRIFLSDECKRAFSKKIYMEPLDKKLILNALVSEISPLNLYNDDLEEDYKNSLDFQKKVAYEVIERMNGLCELTEAIENVALEDYKKGYKVLKKGSLLRG